MILTPRYEQALVFAAAAHRHQRRKGTDIPYISHPLAVSALVLEHGGSEDEAIAALLHDVVEDCGVTLGEISARFGTRVADIVEGCSDSLSPDPTTKAPWKQRKEAYLAHLEHASPSELLVSAADKLHNARCVLADFLEVGNALWNRFRTGSKDDILWYYEEIAKVLTFLGAHPRLVGEFRRVVSVLGRMARGGAWADPDESFPEDSAAGVSLVLEDFQAGPGGTSSRLSVHVKSGGHLVMEGYDLGTTPMRCFGDSDYEYWVTVRGADKDRLLLHLIAALVAEEDRKSSRFMEWLKSKGIPYEFASY